MRPRVGTRGHLAYWAFVVHRISGVGLAVFLPFHFYVLAMAVEGAARLDGFLAWTENPLVKVAEAGLVILLAAHLAGGLRLLALEFLPWRDRQKDYIAMGGGFAFVAGLFFLLGAF